MKNKIVSRLLAVAVGAVGAVGTLVVWAGVDRPSEYTNQGSILNTRHNFTFRSQSGSDLLTGGPNVGGGSYMGPSLTNFGEVCVYCHTPHGANASAAAPLWNRNMSTTTYTTYDKLGSSTFDTTYEMTPGGASLPCLSCHDGTQAVDAVINLPGAGNYNASGDVANVDAWRTATGQSSPGSHKKLSGGNTECLGCHSPSGSEPTATDLTVYALGTDLRNDHPVGALYPAPTGTVQFWNTPNGAKSLVSGRTTRWFEEGVVDGRMQKNEVRLYDTGQGAEVECASCHDPHGVPGSDGKFIATFLRKPNSGYRYSFDTSGNRVTTGTGSITAASSLCLTCHAK